MHDTAHPWLSIHCFLADQARLEAFLLDAVAPLVREWQQAGLVDQWFFIRYWEGGPHLRLRLAGPVASREEAAIEPLRARIGDYLSSKPLDRQTYYASHGFDGAPVDPESLSWFEDGSVVRIDYEPELQRYGGVEAVRASERLFAQSSALAIALTRATSGDLARRMATALPLMAATLLSTGRDAAGVAVFFRTYADFWAGYSDANRSLAAQIAVGEAQPSLVAALARLTGGAATGPVAAWAKAVESFVAELAEIRGAGLLRSPFDSSPVRDDMAFRNAVDSILGSHIHMLNNRLGIVPAGELILATNIARAAASLAAAPPATLMELVA